MKNNNPNLITCGTWYNTSICKKIHAKVFEEFIRNARTDRYNIMCYIDANEKENPSEYYYGSRGGGYPLTLTSTTEALVSLSGTINFIGC